MIDPALRNWLQTALHWGLRLALLLLLFAAAGYSLLGKRLYRASEDRQAPIPVVAAQPIPAPEVIEEEPWRTVCATSGVRPVQGSLAQRFRLAGTFFSYDDAGAGPPSRIRKAILDDLAQKSQYLVAEGDTISDVLVRRILPDRILLAFEGREEELFLGFTGPTGGTTSPGEPVPASDPGGGDALEANRYGKRVAENRWVIQRSALEQYYEDLKDDPERIALLYESFKPLYDDQGAITGYHLGIDGEREFLEAVGLREGDAIRSVNSLKMTSQNRAEYFIAEFAKNRLGAVVLDIERDGEARKLIYLIR